MNLFSFATDSCNINNVYGKHVCEGLQGFKVIIVPSFVICTNFDYFVGNYLSILHEAVDAVQIFSQQHVDSMENIVLESANTQRVTRFEEAMVRE